MDAQTYLGFVSQMPHFSKRPTGKCFQFHGTIKNSLNDLLNFQQSASRMMLKCISNRCLHFYSVPTSHILYCNIFSSCTREIRAFIGLRESVPVSFGDVLASTLPLAA
ncbi:uncharacterized protein VTP21DRAFT_9693 [Calcarisporiella thermophila]|uniref:uncharacterized protein n=1 Tax=Calcarisporiella thermophila TaxID=911321 RepID=UPI00374238BD